MSIKIEAIRKGIRLLDVVEKISRSSFKKVNSSSKKWVVSKQVSVSFEKIKIIKQEYNMRKVKK